MTRRRRRNRARHKANSPHSVPEALLAPETGVVYPGMHGSEGPPSPPPPPSRRRRGLRWFAWSVLVLLFVTLGVVLYREMQTSALQARYLSDLAHRLSYYMEPRPAPAGSLRFPTSGPYAERLGYVHLPQFIQALTAKGYPLEAQARMSPDFRRVVDWGLFPIYHEKDQAGLVILDRYGQTAFSAHYPERIYDRFESIPVPVVDSLLFIENRELLDPRQAARNPAVEWDRLAKVVGEFAVSTVVQEEQRSAGGSTLATQIEKYRHSPGGITANAKAKLRQMATASLRSYLEGENTLAARRRIVLSYINTVPLAARPGYGEVNGLGDGLWAWYGTDLDTVTKVLLAHPGPNTPEARDQARVYKQMLSLFIAQRRPSFYLANPARLNVLTDVYLDLMAKERVISSQLRREARRVVLVFRENPARRPTTFAASKANNAIRGRLAAVLGVPRLYELDRLDLTVKSTLDAPVQASVTKVLRELQDPAKAAQAELYGERLLAQGDDLTRIVYSFTLMERSSHGNLVRVQTDNFDQPFDINEGVKLELGSTAKLRTLITYLDVIAALHDRYAGKSKKELAAEQVDKNNILARWALDYLRSTEDKSLKAMLEAAMGRMYSANPNEAFFTGGGVMRFENFKKEDNGKILEVRDALKDSVNLVFVRMMRDIVRYYTWQVPGSSAQLLEDANEPRRAEYLARFADREGTQFIQRYYRKYQDKTAAEAQDVLLSGIRLTPVRLAIVYNSTHSLRNVNEFRALLKQYLPATALSDKEIQAIYDKYTTDRYSLMDRGFIARVHPLELWVIGYLHGHPGASFKDTVAASKNERQEVYRWLYKTRHKNAQDNRIRYLLEVEAFAEILRDWKRVGYPFDSLVPSYATALGSSADRPAALAELMGIIVNDGLRYPAVRIEGLHFAKDTPYETVIGSVPVKGERVIASEVAQTARRALAGVVAAGTARRLGTPFVRVDGTVIPIGGKTGTGDNRYDVFGRGGALVQSRVLNRTATFVFYIGDRYFGTLTAYVPGAEAGQYKFTSALPVQILKAVAPTLAPMVLSPEPAALPPIQVPMTGLEAPDTVPMIQRVEVPEPEPLLLVPH